MSTFKDIETVGSINVGRQKIVGRITIMDEKWPRLDLRTFAPGRDGEHHPTGRGFSISPPDIAAFEGMVNKGLAAFKNYLEKHE